jgi:hypothetical protein
LLWPSLLTEQLFYPLGGIVSATIAGTDCVEYASLAGAQERFDGLAGECGYRGAAARCLLAKLRVKLVREFDDGLFHTVAAFHSDDRPVAISFGALETSMELRRESLLARNSEQVAEAAGEPRQHRVSLDRVFLVEQLH